METKLGAVDAKCSKPSGISSAKCNAVDCNKEMQEQQSVLTLGDVREDARWRSYSGGEKVRAWMATPLFSGGELLGALLVDSQQIDAFDERSGWLASTSCRWV